MNPLKSITLSALLTIGAFSAVTFTACTKDDTGCNIGYTGNKCDTEVRASYNNTYKGDGTDSDGGTYTNWGLVFAPTGAAATDMMLTLIDGNSTPQLNFNVTLTSNTTFNVVAKTVGNFSYSGTGTINVNTATLTLKQVDNTGAVNTLVFTFFNMNKI